MRNDELGTVFHSSSRIHHSSSITQYVSRGHSRSEAGAAEPCVRGWGGAVGTDPVRVAAADAEAEAFGARSRGAGGLAAGGASASGGDLDEPRPARAALDLRAAGARRLRVARLLGAVRGRVERALSGAELQRPAQPSPGRIDSARLDSRPHREPRPRAGPLPARAERADRARLPA